VSGSRTRRKSYQKLIITMWYVSAFCYKESSTYITIQIMSLYTDTLTKLRNHPLSVDLLRAFTPFFASAFSRIPPPALGPLAFQAFWKATYHGKDEFFREIPPKLRACLKAFDDAYGDDLAIGLSHDVESQSVCPWILSGKVMIMIIILLPDWF
jgi:hypothetical protein